MANKLFDEYLEEYWFRDYHGTKDDAEASYERWLTTLDVNDVIELGDKAMGELKARLDYQQDEKRRHI